MPKRQPPGPPLARETPTVCALCERPLGRRTEWHHVLPKSQGGRETVPLHPICHRAIHAALDNKQIARLYPTIEALPGNERLTAFLKWIANKPPDFNAPTRRAGR